jgi:hypothetical protein
MWQMWDKKPWESSGYPGVSSRYGYMDMSKNWVYPKKTKQWLYHAIYGYSIGENEDQRSNLGTPCSDKPCSPFPKSWHSASDKSIFNGLKWSILRLKCQQMSESKERVTLVS